MPWLVKDKAKAKIANRQGRRGVSKTNGAVCTLVSVHKQASALLPRGDSLLYGCAEEWPRPNPFTHFTGRRNYTLASSHLLGRICIQQRSHTINQTLCPSSYCALLALVDSSITTKRQRCSLESIMFDFTHRATVSPLIGETA